MFMKSRMGAYLAAALSAPAIRINEVIGDVMQNALNIVGEPISTKGRTRPPIWRESKNPRSKRVKPACQARRKAKLKAGQRRRRAR